MKTQAQPVQLTKEQQELLRLVEAYCFIIEAERHYTFEQFAKRVEQFYSMQQPNSKAVYSFLISNRGSIKKNRYGESKMKCSFPLTFVKEY